MHNNTTTATMPYPSLPASPTLTNPDMILPYGEYDSTPSPPRSGAWKARPEDMDFSQSLTYGGNSLGSVPMTPITPIIYGNGTMLSDIGEVTEAESTAGVGVRRIQNRLAKRGESPVRSSPTVPYQGLTKRSKAVNHRRTVSMGSDSTVTTEGPTEGVFDDFDDTVSVDESAFQGDDEESVVDEGYRRPIAAEVKTMIRKEIRELDVRNETEEGETNSAVLSRRAEIILANAKKRLDTMEGNLTRARSSLEITTSSSIHSSSPLSRSTPSPPQQHIVPQMGVPPARHRQLGPSSLGPHSPGHSRISSENSLPTSPTTSIPVSRTFPSGKQLNPSPKFIPPIRTDFYDSKNSSHQSLISPTSDSSVATVTLEGGSDGDRISPYDTNGLVRSSTAEPYSHHEIDRRGLTRSSSSMQMRDLSDKMKDLKGKISTLRDRAREDTLKRRSVQSLRTPSPFTVAEPWYTSSKDYKDGHLSVDAGISLHPWNNAANGRTSPEKSLTLENGHVTEEIPEYQESEAPSVYEDVEEELAPSETYGNVLGSFSNDPLNQEDVYEQPDELEDDLPENGDQDVDEEVSQGDYSDESVDHDELADENYESDDGESLYHETLQTPISHEDREDAFDYEHFFLHSALGTISQQRHDRRGSVNSFTSEDSVETTRGPEASSSYKDHLRPVSLGHKRQQSADTVSTMATFATAKEGYSDGADNDVTHDYAVQNVLQTHPQETTDSKYTSPTITQWNPPQQWRNSEPNPRPSSVIKGGIIQPASTHRPSVSSFASTSSGTTRSFPLVNKPKPAATNSAPATTSNSPSPMDPTTMLGIALTTGMATGFANGNGSATTQGERATQPSPVSMLYREDQILVDRLVASMGKCVLGLQEARRGSAESRMWRRRLEAARRALEGDEGVA